MLACKYLTWTVPAEQVGRITATHATAFGTHALACPMPQAAPLDPASSTELQRIKEDNWGIVAGYLPVRAATSCEQ